jgi:hypothetical protein
LKFKQYRKKASTYHITTSILGGISEVSQFTSDIKRVFDIAMHDINVNFSIDTVLQFIPKIEQFNDGRVLYISVDRRIDNIAYVKFVDFCRTLKMVESKTFSTSVIDLRTIPHLTIASISSDDVGVCFTQDEIAELNDLLMKEISNLKFDNSMFLFDWTQGHTARKVKSKNLPDSKQELDDLFEPISLR